MKFYSIMKVFLFFLGFIFFTNCIESKKAGDYKSQKLPLTERTVESENSHSDESQITTNEKYTDFLHEYGFVHTYEGDSIMVINNFIDDDKFNRKSLNKSFFDFLKLDYVENSFSLYYFNEEKNISFYTLVYDNDFRVSMKEYRINFDGITEFTEEVLFADENLDRKVLFSYKDKKIELVSKYISSVGNTYIMKRVFKDKKQNKPIMNSYDTINEMDYLKEILLKDYKKIKNLYVQ